MDYPDSSSFEGEWFDDYPLDTSPRPASCWDGFFVLSYQEQTVYAQELLAEPAKGREECKEEGLVAELSDGRGLLVYWP